MFTRSPYEETISRMSFNFKALSARAPKSEPLQDTERAPVSYTPKGLKFAIIFSFILSAAALAGAGILFNELTAEKKQREVLESSQAQLQEKAEVFEKSSNAYKTDMAKIQSELKAYASEKTDLKKQLDDSRSQIDDLRNKVKNIQEKNKTIEETAADEIRESTASSGSSLSYSSSSQPASAQTSAAASKPAQPAAPVEVKVLSVNRKFNFAVVNIGLSQKLKIGDPLHVIRAGKTVGRLQVEKLYEGFCAASILQESKEAPVQEGDAVKQIS